MSVLFPYLSVLRAMIDDQFAQIDAEIPTQLAQQRRVDSLEVISAIPVKVSPREIQILADLIFGNAFLSPSKQFRVFCLILCLHNNLYPESCR